MIWNKLMTRIKTYGKSTCWKRVRKWKILTTSSCMCRLSIIFENMNLTPSSLNSNQKVKHSNTIILWIRIKSNFRSSKNPESTRKNRTMSSNTTRETFSEVTLNPLISALSNFLNFRKSKHLASCNMRSFRRRRKSFVIIRKSRINGRTSQN